MKIIHLISGGTTSGISCHLSLCAPAYGNTDLKEKTIGLQKEGINGRT